MDKDAIYRASKGDLIALAPSDQFTQLVLLLCTKLGIEAPKDMIPVNILRQFIEDQFQWCTIQDLSLAVDLNMANRLPQRSEHYGQLSSAFVGHLLGVYEPIKGKVVSEYRRIEESASDRLKLKGREMTNRDWEEMYNKNLSECLAGKEGWDYLAPRMIQWLEDSGKIKEDDFTEDEYRMFVMEAKRRVMDRRRIGRVAVQTMPHAERARFDDECVVERYRVLYGVYLRRNQGRVGGK